MFDANDAGGETDADRIGERNMGRKCESDFELGASLDGAVEVEKNTAGTDVLGFGLNFVGAFEANNGRQAHIKTPHHPPFL